MVGAVGAALRRYYTSGRWVRRLIVAALALGCSALAPHGAVARQLPPATLSFHSQPALHPPAVAVTSDPDTTSGDIFLTPHHCYQGGPMILDPQGQLIWFTPVSAWTANLEVQYYLGQPVLTWWQGKTPTSNAEDVILNTRYEPVAIVRGGDGYTPDLHEFQITPQGTALIDVVGLVNHYPMTSRRGTTYVSVYNDGIQEVTIQTGQVVWQWSALDHVPVTASYKKIPSSGGYDYFHLNSIQQLPDGDLLVSSRNTSSIYLIDRRTGDIVWTLGGKWSSFKFGPGARFHWQHDARLVGQTLTLFDNNWGGPSYPQRGQSRAMTLHLDMATMSATLVHSYPHSPSVTSGAQGSMQTLPNGDVFVGWGGYPDFSEYTPGGTQIFNGNFALGVESYRAYRFPWTAQPSWRPALDVTPSPGGGTTLYASWNGATQVASWRILGGPSPNSLGWVSRAPKRGFETTVNLRFSMRYFAVQALDAQGNPLGTSAAEPR